MTTTVRNEFAWNLVTKNLHGHELLRKKIRQKISKLERHLKHFPADSVHLHIGLERHPRRKLYTAALTLRVPSNILRSEKTASDVIKAFDTAVKALLRELESLKAELRREVFWKRKTRRGLLRELKTAGFAAQPQAEGTGPQTDQDVLRDLLAQHSRRLLRYARRHLWHDIAAGELPRGAVDARAVVDEAARQALTAPQKKPAKVNWLLWLYRLVRQELARRIRELKGQAAQTVPLETRRVLSEDAEAAAGYDAEQPLDIIETALEPPLAETKELLPDVHAEPPDQAVARRELLAQMRKTANSWPKPEREVFELYFVEGFEPDEVAMILGQPLRQVQTLITRIQQRLRAEVLEQALP